MAQANTDLSPLASWLAANTDLGADCAILSSSRPKTGFSADTLLVTVAAGGATKRLVIRIDHPGRTLFLHSTIERQARMMQALAQCGIPVPVVLAWTDDLGPLGAPFLVMEHVEGTSLPQHPSYHVAGLLFDLDAAARRRTWQEALSTIARINRIDWRDDLGFLMEPAYGQPGLDHYLGWLRAWRNYAFEGGHPVIDAALGWLDANRPETEYADLLWGDSNPGNFLFHSDGAVSAALDFEAAAVGPAEIDLGTWFVIDRMLAGGNDLPPGMPDRAEQIAIYQTALGRPVANLAYFETLAATRMAIIVANLAHTLKRLDVLPPENQGGIHNPISSMLAAMLDMPHPGTMEDYMRLVGVMNDR